MGLWWLLNIARLGSRVWRQGGPEQWLSTTLFWDRRLDSASTVEASLGNMAVPVAEEYMKGVLLFAACLSAFENRHQRRGFIVTGESKLWRWHETECIYLT